MNPIKIFIKDFLCYDYTEIDFRNFNAALILACSNGNEEVSNGAGKSSFFRTIEYAIFNDADMNLDRLIRDDTDYCHITFDFAVRDQVYRIVRKRTKSNVHDVSLYMKINPEAEHVFKTEESVWKNLSGRRNSDTEKYIEA